MNIYMTGASRLQTNTVRVYQIRKLDVPRGLVNTLKENGHQVEWRKTPLGEELPPADINWVNIAPAGSTNAPHLLGAFWAIHKAKTQREPLVVFFDDWQFRQVINSFRTVHRKGTAGLLREVWGSPIYDEPKEMMEKYGEIVCDIANDFVTGELFNYAVGVIPKFAQFGDISVVENQMPGNPSLLSIDPTPYSLGDWVDIAEPTTMKDKRDAWLLASLMPHHEWAEKLNTGWPLEHIGNRKIKAPRLKTEKDVALAYHQVKGVLSPPYNQAGSGWFRTRFLYAAGAGSIIYCGDRDTAQFGKHAKWFDYATDQVESMGIPNLEMIAKAQQTIILDHITTSTNTATVEMNEAFDRAYDLTKDEVS